MSPFEDTLIFHADFNSLLDTGEIMVARRYASSPRKPENGERVLLMDDEGNQCVGVVLGADDRAVRAVAYLETWTPGDSFARTDSPIIDQTLSVEVTAPDEEREPKLTLEGQARRLHKVDGRR